MNGQSLPLSRRALLAGGALLLSRPLVAKPRLKIAIFSKHLQFVQGEALAATAAEIGYDGVDIALRRGGHVDPAAVAKDLPALAATLRKAGLEVPMVTTGIVDDATPFAEDILKACSALGIHHYRFGGFNWNANQPYEAQLEAMKPRLARLAALNARYQMCGMYHTHSGVGLVGASIWDLWSMMRDLDPKAIGINFDIGHATVEGGASGWINSFKISGEHVRGIAVKDFVWGKDAKGAWEPQWMPLGQGMVHLDEFFKMVAQSTFDGPVQIHYEYDLGGIKDGVRTLTLPRAEVVSGMKRDLTQLRTIFAKAGV